MSKKPASMKTKGLISDIVVHVFLVDIVSIIIKLHIHLKYDLANMLPNKTCLLTCHAAKPVY